MTKREEAAFRPKRRLFAYNPCPSTGQRASNQASASPPSASPSSLVVSPSLDLSADGATIVAMVKSRSVIALSTPFGRVTWLMWIERSEEHTSELQSLMRISYAVFCLQ